MTQTETPTISRVAELLAANGYEVAESGSGVIRVTDLETHIAFQAALEGNVLYMSVNLITLPSASLTAEMMRRMLASDNGITTSAFQLFDTGDGKTAIALSNFCTLQNMGEEDRDDVLSLAGYLMADSMEARELLEPMVQKAKA